MMALEFVGGAILRTAIAELLKSVIDAKKKHTNFHFILTRLESTIISITPHVDEISKINQKFDHPDEEMKEVIALLEDGKALVQKSAKISSMNFYRKRQYSKELVDLDYSLLRVFQIILPLDHFRNNKEILFMVKDLHAKFVGDDDKKEEIEESDKAKEGFVGVGMSKTMKLHQDSEKEQAMKVDKYSKKEEPRKSYSKNVERKFQSAFFLLERCPYSIDLEDLLRAEAEVLGKGTYGTSYKCNIIGSADGLVVKRLRDVNFGEMTFKQRIKHLGKIRQHPNVIPIFGCYFSKDEKLLLYDYAPAGSLCFLLHENRERERTPLNWESRVKISLGAARGISHIHSEGAGIKLIHGNIKSSNVLLNSDLDGCISDYGLASIINMKSFPTTFQKPGYHAPEFLETSKATKKSEVYSFGVMLLEILTTKNPTLVDLPRCVSSTIREQWTLDVFDKELLLLNQDYEEEMVKMLQIAMQCVEKEPDGRPEMDDVVRMIEKIQSSH